MNQYLYPWHDLEGNNEIGVVYARSYTDCVEKLSKHLIDKYENLDDTLEFDDLLDQLGELYGVYIGVIYDITEF
jgi:hypothetical protein